MGAPCGMGAAYCWFGAAKTYDGLKVGPAESVMELSFAGRVEVVLPRLPQCSAATTAMAAAGADQDGRRRTTGLCP